MKGLLGTALYVGRIIFRFALVVQLLKHTAKESNGLVGDLIDGDIFSLGILQLDPEENRFLFVDRCLGDSFRSLGLGLWANSSFRF